MLDAALAVLHSLGSLLGHLYPQQCMYQDLLLRPAYMLRPGNASRNHIHYAVTVCSDVVSLSALWSQVCAVQLTQRCDTFYQQSRVTAGRLSRPTGIWSGAYGLSR